MNSEPAIVYWGQPNGNACSETRVVFCAARIDNRSELARTLGTDEDQPDDALLLLAYRKFGRSCAKHIIGDFAFAIWDSERREVFAARDHIGCQPVYYHSNAERFAIAESIEQLLTVPGVGHGLDEPFVAAILSRFYSHPERTYFAEIKKIPPAHTLTLRPEFKSLDNYWRPESVPRIAWTSAAECGAAFRDILRQAVRDRLPTSGRLGVHLSGGLDCSSVTAFAADELRQTGRQAPLAFAWQPDPRRNTIENECVAGEYERIQSVCEQDGLEAVYCTQTKDHFLDVLRRDDTVRHVCGGSYGEWIVQKEAATRGVTTIMSGFGGDEAASYAGGGYHAGLALRGRWKTLYQQGRVMGLNPWRYSAGQFVTGLEHLLLPDRIFVPYNHGLQHMRLSRWKSLVRAVVNPDAPPPRLLSADEEKDLYEQQNYVNPEFRSRIEPLPPWRTHRKTSANAVQCQALQMGHLTNRIESWAADGAVRGIKYVYPLLDRRVLEFALGLPEHAFTDGVWNRLFFRQAMDPVLPKNVCWERSNVEPSRSLTLKSVATEGFAEVGKMLSAGAIKSPRAKYLDMERLTRDLQPEALRNREKMGRLFFAVQFLGIEGT